MRHKRASPKESEAITDKELLELSELEAKATPGKIGRNGGGDIVGGDKILFAFNNEQIEVGKGDDVLARSQLLCALRNRAKEIISELTRTRSEVEKLREAFAVMRGVSITNDPHYFERRKINVITQLIIEALPEGITNDDALAALKRKEEALKTGKAILEREKKP